MINPKQVQQIFNKWKEENKDFSGVFSLSDENGVIYEEACGFRNKAEQLSNQLDTAFAIASGTKLFTALAICKLADQGKLSLEDRIRDILPHDLKNIHKDVTVYHLLTHTSGVGDYLDEEEMEDDDDGLALFDNHPPHKWLTLDYYLPMINILPPKFTPGEDTSYSNSGFILLGLVIESISKQPYQTYVREQLIEPLGLTRTGFYPSNALPGNTAIGYCFDEEKEEYVTNTLFIPIIGGSDGGIFTCAGDFARLWQGVFACELFSKEMLTQFLTPCKVSVSDSAESSNQSEDDDVFGLGLYVEEGTDKTFYSSQGWDFGVSFLSLYFPEMKVVATALRNVEIGAYDLMKELLTELKLR